jgi:hypothetical protein
MLSDFSLPYLWHHVPTYVGKALQKLHSFFDKIFVPQSLGKYFSFAMWKSSRILFEDCSSQIQQDNPDACNRCIWLAFVELHSEPGYQQL